ncbi:hypothetical protein EYF80_046665 [Liparis tanakae]|uniref:Uncharacterized protein n=1 Tax=Liparis tanakae TaxID=230148 RepID=A0A4Z2FQR0_9TELE|nr:hypothetical protein EYF80_046665 [Liparis tanakae]
MIEDRKRREKHKGQTPVAPSSQRVARGSGEAEEEEEEEEEEEDGDGRGRSHGLSRVCRSAQAVRLEGGVGKPTKRCLLFNPEGPAAWQPPCSDAHTAANAQGNPDDPPPDAHLAGAQSLRIRKDLLCIAELRLAVRVVPSRLQIHLQQQRLLFQSSGFEQYPAAAGDFDPPLQGSL